MPKFKRTPTSPAALAASLAQSEAVESAAPETQRPDRPEAELYVGGRVLFKMPEGPGQGELRPAIIVAFVDDDAPYHRDTVALEVITHRSEDSNATTFFDWVRRGSRLGEWQPLIPYNWQRERDKARPE